MSLWTRYDLKIAGVEAEIKKIPKLYLANRIEVGPLTKDFKLLLPGRYAVSVCIVQGTMGVFSNIEPGDPIDNGYTYFQEFEPVGHVGHSIWLYDLSEDDIRRSHSWGALYRRIYGGETEDADAVHAATELKCEER